MGLRLAFTFGAAVAATVAFALRARATQDAQARVTLFREPPPTQNEGIKVHPQIDAGTSLGPDFHFAVGYGWTSSRARRPPSSASAPAASTR